MPPAPPEKTIGPLGGRRAGRPPQSQDDSKANPECRGYFGSPFPLNGEGWLYARRLEIESILTPLENFVGRPVIDRTGLTGLWDVDIKWDPDLARSDDVRSDRDRFYGSIFTAVREQLGLSLQGTNADSDVVVIERLQQPTPN